MRAGREDTVARIDEVRDAGPRAARVRPRGVRDECTFLAIGRRRFPALVLGAGFMA